MPTDVLIGVAVTWLLTGVITGIVMRRQGHDLFVWLALGSVLGPLVVPLAVNSAREIKVGRKAAQAQPDTTNGGLDLLLAVDGSDDALRAARSAIEMFGLMASSVTVATVLPYEAETSTTGTEDQANAQKILDGVVSELDYAAVGTKLLFGRPDAALVEYAFQSGAEVIVVGPRGHGASEAVFGSVAKNVVAAGSIPVLVGARTIEPSRPYMGPD